jgi:hypothetical protein
VGADEQVTAVADGVPQARDIRLCSRKRLEARLARVERGVRPNRIELQRRESHGDVGGGAFGRQVRVRVHVSDVARLGVQVRVRTEPLVHTPAEELVDRLAHRLADDVPARHLDPAQHAAEQEVGAAGVPPHGDDSTELLDPKRVCAEHVLLEHVLERPLDHGRMQRCGVDLADPRHAVVGRELEEDEVAPSEGGRRVADDEGLELRDLHGRRDENDGSQWTSSESFAPNATRSETIGSRLSGGIREMGMSAVSAASVTPSSLTTGTDTA